jgi:hypothetical protein
MGALSNTEGATATAAITRLSTQLSAADFQDALADFEQVLNIGLERARAIDSGAIVETPLQPPPPSSAEIDDLLNQYAPRQ